NRVSDGYLAARSRPDFGRKSVRRELHPPIRRGRSVPGTARPRTREQTAASAGVEPTRSRFRASIPSEGLAKKRKGQDSNLQGLAPRPASNRVPSCLLACPSVFSCPGRTRTCNRLGNNQPH